ncbi:uncharacterized protein [Amphiura filiformis]|uniref:uncharacterized protein n=1 Tax=Amphiura filiformis TaxID=82378 RepID=UPI003B2137AE
MGNTDNTSPVMQRFPEPVAVIAIRIRPKAWHRYISMRFELQGCIEKKDACLGDSRFGWSTLDRSGGQTRVLDTNDWTFVIPGKETPCDGVITHWNFWAKRSEPFRAIVWRRVANEDDQFKIVGINNIPASLPGQEIHHTVDINEHIYTKEGDVLGFAFKRPLLAYQSGSSDSAAVRWFRNTDPYEMVSGEVYSFDGTDNRAYLLQAIIRPIANVNDCTTQKGRWGQAELIPCNRGLQMAEFCPGNVTRDIDGELTWPETAVGELGFSDEKCSFDTHRAGWPLALRYCSISTGSAEQAKWEPVYMVDCSEEAGDEGFCPDGWDPHGPFCYFVNVELRLSFNDAVFACQNMTSNLTSIHSDEEQYYHLAIVRRTSQDLWIGLHDKTNEHEFEWVDGTPLDFESWTPNQPDNHNLGEDCVQLWSRGSGNWNDSPCGSSLGFICKKPKGIKTYFTKGE